MKFAALVVLACSTIAASAQVATRPSGVRTWVEAHQAEIMQEYLQLLSIPDTHGDIPNLQRNAEALHMMLQHHGMQAQVWQGAGAPVVFAQRTVPQAKRTILFYIHYDGQESDAKKWSQPDPFKPVVRNGSLDAHAEPQSNLDSVKSFPAEWRVYARGAADDRGPILAFCAAMSAIQQDPASNIKLYLDGEEEGSGPSMDDALTHHAEDLKADLMILLDGPQHASGRPTIFYGARGGAGLEVTVYTARQGMHSGNYGNWMPDANVRLSQLIASMVAPNGRVLIKGFYDDVAPFDEATRAMFNAVPDNTAAMRAEFGIGSVDDVAPSLQEDLNLPSLSIHDMKGGEVGGVIPGSATARIAMRLVPETQAATMIGRVVEHVRSQGYYVLDTTPDLKTLAAHPRIARVTFRAGEGAGGAWRTDPASPAARFVLSGVSAVWGQADVVQVRTLGGSVPARPFIDRLHLPVIGISLANYDDNQHTDNENMRLGNLWDGIETLSGVLTQQ